MDEVVEKANNTEYGLASAIWSKDVSKVYSLSKVFSSFPPQKSSFSFSDLSRNFMLVPFGSTALTSLMLLLLSEDTNNLDGVEKWEKKL